MFCIGNFEGLNTLRDEETCELKLKNLINLRAKFLILHIGNFEELNISRNLRRELTSLSHFKGKICHFYSSLNIAKDKRTYGHPVSTRSNVNITKSISHLCLNDDVKFIM